MRLHIDLVEYQDEGEFSFVKNARGCQFRKEVHWNSLPARVEHVGHECCWGCGPWSVNDVGYYSG